MPCKLVDNKTDILEMLKNGLFFSVYLCLIPMPAYSQQINTENSDCLSIESFQTKCEVGLHNLVKYLNDSILSDADHKNIMHCYNQLHWDIIGEPIERLLSYDSSRKIYQSELKDERFNHDQIEMFSKLWNDYNLLYKDYVSALKQDYEHSYGLGGALYFDQLKTYSSTANGMKYFVLCR